jgi:hypothetical protein
VDGPILRGTAEDLKKSGFHTSAPWVGITSGILAACRARITATMPNNTLISIDSLMVTMDLWFETERIGTV